MCLIEFNRIHTDFIKPVLFNQLELWFSRFKGLNFKGPVNAVAGLFIYSATLRVGNGSGAILCLSSGLLNNKSYLCLFYFPCLFLPSLIKGNNLTSSRVLSTAI